MGSDHIIHAGDIGDPKIMEELALIAPVTAVRGNNDKSIWAEMLPVNDRLKVGEVVIRVLLRWFLQFFKYAFTK